jgi:DNA-directed RNA polymerase specialized sigma24 family protein
VAERTADAGAAAEFERLYRANVDAVTAYFARRTTDPQLVADLTADTYRGRGSGRGHPSRTSH